VSGLYNESKGGERCPGEDDCHIFQGQAPPKCQACELCPLQDTKPSHAKEEMEAALSHIERLARERGSGRRLNLSTLSSLEWELLLVWDEAHAAQQRAHQARVASMFEVLVQLTAAR